MTKHQHSNHKPWYKTPLYLTLIFTGIFVLISSIYTPLHPVQHAFWAYWEVIWWAILLGLGIAGVIEALVPNQYILHYLARPTKTAILYSTLLGFVMSACSHGILAIAMELYKKGASTSAVIAFLLASPWANLAITIMLIGFFGLKALLFVFSAILIAILTGFIYQILEKKGLVESNSNPSCTQSDFSVWSDIQKRALAFQWTPDSLKTTAQEILRGAWHVTHMVLWWVIIGILIGSFIEAFVPQDFMQDYMGPSILGLFVTLGVATIIEVCSEGSSPIAFTIYKQTGAFGNAFIFLMAGVITDITELGLIWSNIGKKAAIWLPIVTIPQAMCVAYLLNAFL